MHSSTNKGGDATATRRRGGDTVQTRDVLFDQALPEKADAQISYILEHRHRSHATRNCLTFLRHTYKRRIGRRVISAHT